MADMEPRVWRVEDHLAGQPAGSVALYRRFISAAPYTSRLFVHQVRLTDLDDLDDQFGGWIREAYAVGQGAHMA
jgi:hypothetical protein